MRILAVDDEPFIREILPKFTAKANFIEVETAESGQAALRIIKESSPLFGCFLLDISMPDMTGIELCERIRALPSYSRTPIIMLTAMVDRHFIDLAFQAGATDYATKPFDLIELGTRLRAAQELNDAQTEKKVSPQDNSYIKPIKSDIPRTQKFIIPGRGQFLDPNMIRSYLGQLSDDARKPTWLTAAMIDGWETLKLQTTEANLATILAWVGSAIDDVMHSTGYFMSYWGDGIFMIVHHRSTPASGQTFDAAIKGQVETRRKTASKDAPPRFSISMTAPLLVTDSGTGGADNALQNAKRLVKERSYSKGKISQSFARLSWMLSGSKRRDP